MSDPLLDTVAAIYAAALQPEGWPDALSRLNELISSMWVVMALLPLGGGAELVVQDQEASTDHLAFFRRNYNSPETNPAIPSLMKAGHGAIILREQDMNDEEWQNCGLYRHVYRPAGLYHGIGAFVLKTDSHVAFLGANRPKKRGQFGQRDIDLLRGLTAHIDRALQMTLKLTDLQSQKAIHEMLWDNLAFGVVLLDQQGKVLWTNREAETILSREDGLAIRNKVLYTASADENARLQRSVRIAVGTSETCRIHAGAPLHISRSSVARPFVLLIAPFHMERPFVRRPAAVVFITDPERKSQTPCELLRKLYGLTGREAMLTELLLQGIDLREAAQKLDISMNTARTHLRLIFEKTDTHRQTELVRLLLRGPAGLI